MVKINYCAGIKRTIIKEKKMLTFSIQIENDKNTIRKQNSMQINKTAYTSHILHQENTAVIITKILL